MEININIGGFAGLLTILFVGLKLTHFINWSWLWVLCPLWIGFAFAACIWLFFLGTAALAFFFGSR